jgi:hypothetical protein
MDIAQLAWLAPVAVTLLASVPFGLYLCFARDVPEGWRGSRLSFAVSHSAFMTPCFALVPALAQVFSGNAVLGVPVVLVSLATIVGCVLTMRRLDGREHDGFWDWLAINANSASERDDGPG